MKWRSCFCFVPLLAAQVAVGPGPQPQTARTLKPEESGAIEGVVRAAEGDQPLKKARVAAMPMDRRTPGADGIATATSGADGRYRITKLAPGQYRVTAERSGYVNGEHGSKGMLRPGIPVVVSKGQTAKADFGLIAQAVVTGRVIDEDGDPVQGAMVSLERYMFINGARQLVPMNSSNMTNDLGEYRLFGVAPGRYYLSANYRSRMFFGNVREESGPGGLGYTGTYFPSATDPSAATMIEVTPGARLGGTEIRLQKMRLFAVRGKVTGGDGRRTMLMLVPRGGVRIMPEQNTTTSDAQGGEFEIRNVKAGSYVMVASASDSEGTRLAARAMVEVGEHDVENVALTLQAGAELTGKVRVDEGGDIVLSGMMVNLFQQDATPYGGGGQGEVKPDGTFKVRSLIQDKFRVNVFGVQGNSYVKAVRNGGVELSGDEVDFTGGVAGPLEIVVSPNGGQVTGTVRGEDDQPRLGAVVILFSADKRASLTKTATADQAGSYSIQGIAPGEYLLAAVAEHERGAESDPGYLAALEKKAEKVGIKEKTSETRNLKTVTAGY